MRSSRRCFASVALFALAASAHLPAHAAGLVVDANTRPWEWTAGGVNSDYYFGIGTPIAPVVVDGASFGFHTGDILRIEATGGVSAGPGFAFVDPDGNLIVPGEPTTYAGLINDVPGDSGGYFPSRYTPADWDTNLMALMGTFADGSGAIVGTPFEIGRARNVAVPVGATRLQIGINDDVLGDNSGSFDVTVTAVPEPGAAWTLLGGLAVMAAAGRLRTRRLSHGV